MLPGLRSLAVALVVGVGATALGQPKPDLVSEIRDVLVDPGAFPDPGDVTEGCASATSGVDLLRFTAITRNVGSANLVLGDPRCPDCADNPGARCGNPLFHCSPAGGHMHPHYTNYASYELLDAANQVVAVGGKFGFCVEDSLCPDGIGRVYNCDYQGLTIGCADEYPYSLGCQYIDITAVASGTYTLRMTADPSGEIDEGDETNNVTLVPVAIAKPREPDEEMPGAWVRLDSAPQPTPLAGPAKLLKFIARGTAPIDLPDAPHAPTLVGASVRARDTVLGTDLLIQLPRAGWRGLGQPPGSIGYRYHGSLQPGDCRSALITSSRVRAVCQIAGAPITPIGGDLAVTLTTGDGSKRYCATFGGLDVRNDTLRLERRRAPALPCGG